MKFIVALMMCSLLITGNRVVAAQGEKITGEQAGKIYFLSLRKGKQSIYFLQPGSKAVTQVTSSEFSDSEPALSPDGKKILYTSNHARTLDLYVVNAEGGRSEKLTNTKMPAQSGRWSPDGKKLSMLPWITQGQIS